MILEVLCATMNQRNLDIIEKMNIKSDAIISNQVDFNEIITTKRNSRKITMINTKTKGVGLNRNIGLLASKGDIILFSDDDMIYKNDYEEKIIEAFKKIPEADIIIFETTFMAHGKEIKKIEHKTKKVKFYEVMKYGTYSIAARRKSLLMKNIYFSQLFGGGCKYGSGEDSKFLTDCFKNRLKIYTYSYNLGVNIKESSTWFQGFNEKYFYDKGALIESIFKKLKYIVLLYFLIKFIGKTDVKIFKRLKLMIDGTKGFKKGLSYQEREKNNEYIIRS